MKYTITFEEYQAIKKLKMENKDKHVDKKLSIVKPRYEENTYKEIARRIDLSQKQTGNNRNLSFEAEKKVLDACMAKQKKEKF